MNDKEFGCRKLLRFKYRKGHQIIQTFCKIGSPQNLDHPSLFNLYKFENPERSTPESYKMHWNLINDQEFRSTKLLKLKYRMRDQIIQTLCKIGSHQKLGPPLLYFYKFQDSEKSTPESYRIHWNAMNDEEFGSTKLLILKYRMGDQIIQTFCKIVSPRN